VLQRKVVKQTVMTVVYGVTVLGAKDQVLAQLEDLLGETVEEKILAEIAQYLATQVLRSIDEVFRKAMRIKKWFDDVSRICNKVGVPVAWISGVGLPCHQPYRDLANVTVRTPLQKTVLLKEPSDEMKTDKYRQKSGFPPNFIHSLDASHMMMTAEACQTEGIDFAAVHDSFWTHAASVDTMNRHIRDQWINLYSTNILGSFEEDIRARLGSLAQHLQPLPPRGDLDITAVRDSLYFFD